MESYLTELNKAQREAVLHTEGPSLVIAGAGSGKTRVLTYRVAHLLEKGIPAWNILALTFTNRAAQEMKDRIATIVGKETARNLWMGTFHSMFARILRIESARLNYPSNYSIYDTIDSKNLIKEIIRELHLDEQVYKPSEVLGHISMAKNQLITPQMYAARHDLLDADRFTGRPRIIDIYKRYAIRCYKAGAMDFDDLLLNTVILFNDFPPVLEKYRQHFRYVLVDEYQDTNYAQYLIVNKLAAVHKNICVVGDDAQSIYSFRGARIENILHFRNDYPEYRLFKLEQNYRSTQTIVNAANSIIALNKDQIHKKVWSDLEEGEKIEVINAMTDTEEGYIIANSILDRQLAEQCSFNAFAVLYRTNAQSRVFEETLRKRNIPYKVYGAISFYQRKEIKDLIAYFRLVSNLSDDESLKRIINYPARGIGKTTLEKLIAIANERNISIWSVIEELPGNHQGFSKGTIDKLNEFTSLILHYRSRLPGTDAFELASEIVSSTGISKEHYHPGSPEEISKYENIQELLNGIKEFTVSPEHNDTPVTLDRFLENVSLLTDLDTDREDDRDKVKIMTIHSAKGLEFTYVYIAGVEEDLFPSYLSVGTARELEEERRLFYVALTRAKKKVMITHAQSRFRWGTLTPCVPSRFIRELDEQYLRQSPLWQQTSYSTVSPPKQRPEKKPSLPAGDMIPAPGKRLISMKKIVSKESDPGFQADDPGKIQVGMTVEHARFGIGKVLNLEGTNPDIKATVFFPEFGQKQLLLKFARLRITD